jgi:hypothetical protein
VFESPGSNQHNHCNQSEDDKGQESTEERKYILEGDAQHDEDLEVPFSVVTSDGFPVFLVRASAEFPRQQEERHEPEGQEHHIENVGEGFIDEDSPSLRNKFF